MSAEQKPFVQGGIIDGKAVAAAIRDEIAATVRLLKEKHGKVGASHQQHRWGATLPHILLLGCASPVPG
jgi:hypothetical protein